MWPFRTGPRIGRLDDHDEQIWADSEAPPVELLAEATRSLPIAGSALWSKDCRIVPRTLRHTLGWAESYIRVEKETLGAEFVSERKGYSIIVLKCPSLCEINVHFRLTTQDLSGWTSYGIGWRRIDPDLFQCRE